MEASTMRYRTSSACSSGSCVEVGSNGSHVMMRDNKQGADAAPLVFTPAAWAAFLGRAERYELTLVALQASAPRSKCSG